jgi:hypothetical protein
VYGPVPFTIDAIIIPSQLVESKEFVGVRNPPKFRHGLNDPAVILNVNVTGVPLLLNVTLYVPTHRFVTI